MRNQTELTPIQQARLGSVCAVNVEVAHGVIERYKTNLKAAERELFDMLINSEKNGYKLEDLEYSIECYQDYIETTRGEIAQSEVDYEAACELALKYAGLNTLGAFVLTVLSQKEVPRYDC